MKKKFNINDDANDAAIGSEVMGSALTRLKLLRTGLAKLVRMSRPFRLRHASRPVSLATAEDVRNDVTRSHGGVARLHPERDLHVRLALRVRVVLRVLTQPLVDDKLVEVDLAAAHVLADGGEILMYALDDDLRGLARQDLIEHVLGDRL